MIPESTFSALLNAFFLLVGGALGFALNWMLEERKQLHELRRSAGPVRVKAYRALWPLCASVLRDEQRGEQAEALLRWYESGGGLFLSLPAAKRFYQAVHLLRADALSVNEREALKNHLTWLRTEMKAHIGSYSRQEAETQITA
jgi:hypothetical protein